ncbi:MAG: BlaI/MecI/CopY family transcriptional regulator [Patescibacteria group bacterium]
MPTKNTLPGFGALETAIMEVIWAASPVTVRDVLQTLKRDCAYTTVMTVMQRLFDKGVLQRQLVDNAYQYTPAIPKAQFVQQAVRKSVDQLVGGYGDVALAHFVDALDAVDPKRLEKLRRKLNRS